MTDKVERAALGLAALAFAVWSVGFIWRTTFLGLDGVLHFSLFDDAMISMRYAWNLAHGQGLVWNPGGQRVEGYTNLLMVLVMALCITLVGKSAAVIAMQALGILTVLGVAFINARIAGLLAQTEPPQVQRLIRVLSFACVLAYYPLAYWSLMGMETGLLTLWLLSSVYCALQYGRQRKPALLYLLAACLGLAFLTRNDSLLLSIPLWGYVIWAGGKRRPPLAALGGYGCFVVGQFLFRYGYYGEWLPNTYTLRIAGVPLAARLQGGLGFVTPFVLASAPLLIAAALALAQRPARPRALLALPVVILFGYQVSVGGDPWAYWRLLSPAMPLVIVLAVLGLTALAAKVRLPIQARFGLLAAAAVFVSLGWVNARFLPEIVFARPPYQVLDNAKNVNIALALRQVTTEQATVGVIWAGAIPYYAERAGVDFLGKSDPHIARLPPDLTGAVSWSGMKSVPGHNKYDLNYSIGVLQPTYVQRLRWGRQDLSDWGTTAYTRATYHGVELLLRRGSPDVYWERLDAP